MYTKVKPASNKQNNETVYTKKNGMYTFAVSLLPVLITSSKRNGLSERKMFSLLLSHNINH